MNRSRFLLGVLGALGAVSLVVSLTGCGSSKVDDTAAPAQSECRAQWQDLAQVYDTKALAPHPSDLAPRWEALAASARYQTAAGSAQSCGDALDAVETTATRINQLSLRLREYDLQFAFNDTGADVARFLTVARTTLSEARAEGAHKKAQKKAQKQSQRQAQRRVTAVEAAFTALEKAAPAATEDMSAGWSQAVSSDLADPEAQKDLLLDMAFLSRDSGPYVQGLVALRQLRRAVTEDPEAGVSRR